ncbi:flavin reductase family protein [Streptomyces sp. AM8-1-1]|uniref:flavin reductase family protein n=1 Tax=Streptomyces sp. AM8-1-1 TaxID=3075825 RepID=UPI0028C38675|nr:flavin reductase family protein [Streptomyces sp. AM8-1-1]WNO76910.1 flavin reductase family protein [Streptomyces sp. AM8-1-1]
MSATALAATDLTAATAEPAVFRRVLGHVPTSVCVVTATTPQGPVGVTVGSFTSVSLDPPLVVFYCGRQSASAQAIIRSGHFCVNVLAEDQQQVCAAFAGRSANRFNTGDWELTDQAAPRLGGAAAWIECDVEDSFPAGDHVAVVGQVQRLAAAGGPRKPLIFHRGQLVRLDRACGMHVPTHSFDWWDI